MNQSYSDITGLIDHEPYWWDEHGVPRYAIFDPSMVDIYAKEAVLFEIQCQSCRRPFAVSLQWGIRDIVHGHPRLSELITGRQLHYGDPPNVDCCPTGPTMNSIPIRVLEFWERDYEKHSGSGWRRLSEYEVPILPDWAKEEE